jgi:hypothetical protein
MAAIIGLVAVNIAALAYLNIWGLFALGASYPLAERLLGIIEDMDMEDDDDEEENDEKEKKA